MLDGLRDAGTLTVLDAKRGDIGSTMDAYAEAFLGEDADCARRRHHGQPVPRVRLAAPRGRPRRADRAGLFVLALTSNPEGPSVQHAVRDGRSVAGTVVDGVAADNAAARAAGTLGSIGMVVGATVGTAVHDLGLDLAGSAAPLLAPGLGAQGGTPEGLRATFGPAVGQVLGTSSREVLGAGPDVAALRDAARRSAETLATVARAARP